MNLQLAKLESTLDDRLWYKDAVIYQLHVKSFFDSNDDGIGDFPGLISKLDYIADLGAIGTKAPDWVKDHLGLLAAGPEQPLGAASLALMRGGVALRVRARSSWRSTTCSINLRICGTPVAFACP